MTHSRFLPFPLAARALGAALCVAAFCALALFPARSQARGSGPKLPQAGFRSIGVWDPSIPLRMDIAVWYPSSRTPRDLHLEGWTIRAGRNGAGEPGKYPVILLSHTAAASRLASHDLAATLARNGFIVIAPTHPSDNVYDTSGFFHAALFTERPAHLLRALEAVEQSPALRPLMDRSRIGVLGVGAGAATALQLAGAAPDLELLPDYCGTPDPQDPLCTSWAKLFHPAMREEFARILNREALTPAIAYKPEHLSGEAAPPPAPPAARDPAPDPSEPLFPTPSARPQPILAVGLLTPGLVGLFPDASLHSVSAPVGILAAGNDRVYPVEGTVKRLRETLPQRPASRVLAGAGHFDLQAPCPPSRQESFPVLCGDAGSDADDLRQIRNDFFVRFFHKHLGFPLPSPVQSEDQ